MPRGRARGGLLLATLVAVQAACSPSEEGPRSGTEAAAPPPAPERFSEVLPGRPLPPHARAELVAEFREAQGLRFSPEDGQGRASVEPAGPVPAGSLGAWTVRFTAGPAGIRPGGSLVLQVSPFWGWSDPQPFDPAAPGFTRVETDAPGTRLVADSCGEGCLRVGVEEAPLPGGGRIAVHYGEAGPGAARVDRYAEAEEEFFLRVDGDGDGVAAPLADPPQLEILAGPARVLHAVLPSRARVGERVSLQLAALDAAWNAAPGFEGEIRLLDRGGLAGLPERLRFGPEHGGSRRLEAVAERAGVARVVVEVEAWGASFRSNPLVVGDEGPPLLWADLHGHSGRSDGTGTPAQYLAYARDFAGLDVAALTDHDHFGLRFLDETPALWDEIRAASAAFDEPGRFVTLLGFEWTNWLFGHRHVLYFDGEGEVVSSLDPASDEPEELWARLAAREDALTVAHHPGGGPVPSDWSVAPDPRFEPVVEIVSVHGSSECLECPEPIYAAVPGAFVRDALARGYRLGLVGSGDTHDGHPGLGSPENRTVGLAALAAERRDRASVLAALRARRVYATSGPRIVLDFEVAGTPMGGVVGLADPAAPRRVRARAVGTAPILRLDVVKSGGILASREGGGEEVLELAVEDAETVRPGEYLYARVVQEDGGLAWSSPVWVERAAAEGSPGG